MSGASPLRQAVILVGGRGTRLGALTDAIPKPLAEVAGRPFLDWQIEETARYGFERITLLAGYKAEPIVARFDGRTIRGARVETLVESAPMGTAGALALFAERLDPRFLLMNGDTLFAINLLDLPLHAREATATLGLLRTAPGGRYGTVEIDGEGAIHGFKARSPRGGGPINAGVYVLDRTILRLIEPGRSVSMEAEIFPQLAAKGALRGALYDAPFIDIGVPEDLARAQTEIPAMVRRPAVFLDLALILEDRGDGPDEIAWAPGAICAIKTLNDAGRYVFAVSDRIGARGGFAQDRINDELARSGAHLDALAADRPPNRARVIWDLLAGWPVDAERSFALGREDSAVAGATAAGVRASLLAGGDLVDFVAKL